MKRIITVLCLAMLASGCVGDNCFRPGGMGAKSSDCREYRATHPRPEKPGVTWAEYVIFPLFVLGAASDTQRAVTNSPHYQAGGASAIDYTLPQNQPQPVPSYQQQQINNGNGSGRYGNYPKY